MSDLHAAIMSVLEMLEIYPWVLVLVATVYGLVIGSFLNVVVHRVPLMMRMPADTPRAERITLSYPASRCPCCGHAIRAHENIPVLSWLALRGRCSGCHSPISLRYPLVEAFTGALTGVIAWQIGLAWLTPALMAISWVAIAAGLIAVDVLQEGRAAEKAAR